MSILSILTQLFEGSELAIFLSAIAVGIAFYGRYQTDKEIKNNAEATKTRLLHDMAKEERKISFKLFEVAREVKDSDNDKEELTKQKEILIKNHLNFFDHFALLVNKKKLDEDLAREYFGDLVKQAHSKYTDRIYDDYPQFIKLYARWFHPPEEERQTENSKLFSNLAPNS